MCFGTHGRPQPPLAAGGQGEVSGSQSPSGTCTLSVSPGQGQNDVLKSVPDPGVGALVGRAQEGWGRAHTGWSECPCEASGVANTSRRAALLLRASRWLRAAPPGRGQARYCGAPVADLRPESPARGGAATRAHLPRGSGGPTGSQTESLRCRMHAVSASGRLTLLPVLGARRTSLRRTRWSVAGQTAASSGCLRVTPGTRGGASSILCPAGTGMIGKKRVLTSVLVTRLGSASASPADCGSVALSGSTVCLRRGPTPGPPGSWPPLLCRVALSVSVALTGGAHLCLGGGAGFSLRGSLGSRHCRAQRQHSSSQARPTPGPTGSWLPLLRRVALSVSVVFTGTRHLSDASAQFPA
ncbi:hypothetical protein NDU88_006666 [Pleurodeles waltl]|uniref:Uncharacterized protein n=1 Tax=Pleurodeles waltl TaxID=8319 RepID=A0AAV7UPP6_PLEWA|nr:hypothetical protein NDU88_006666 [Pleurodeles waltl]